MHLQYVSVLSCTYCGYCTHHIYSIWYVYVLLICGLCIQYVKQRLNICTVVVQCVCQICTTLIGGF